MARQMARIVSAETTLTRRIARKTILSFCRERGATPIRAHDALLATQTRGRMMRLRDAPLTARSSEIHGENRVDLHAPIGLSMVWLQRPTDDHTCRHTIACPPEEGQTGDRQC